MISSNWVRRALYLATVLTRFFWRRTRASLAMRFTSVLERETERGEQRTRFVVGLGGGIDRDVHAANRVDLVVVDLGEDDLLFHTEAVVAAAVERAVGHASEVADARDGDVDQPIEELVHARAAQSHHAAHRKVSARLEVGDRFPRLGHHRLLAGDLGHVRHREVEHLLVGGGLADAHVERDLLDARHLHHALVAELLREIGHHFLAVELRQARRRRRDARAFVFRDRRRLGLFLLALRLRRGLLLLRHTLVVAAPGLRVAFLFLVFVLGHAMPRLARRYP